MDRPELSTVLRGLADEDLAVRERLAASGELFGGYHPEMRLVHRRNGDRLTEIIDELGCWPGRRLVGEDGSSAAFLIAQHDIANPPLLRRCVELYRIAVEAADADPVGLAKMEDRIRYFEGRPQLYGTHWGWDTEGRFGPWPPVEDPDRVDQRRSELGLPPLAEAVGDTGQGRPGWRPVEEVLAEHQRGEEFAIGAGWRNGEAQHH